MQASDVSEVHFERGVQPLKNLDPLYSGTSSFIMLDKAEMRRTGKAKYITPPNDSIVVVAQCTKIMLEHIILDKVSILTNSEAWTVPILNWINGVPGFGKTTWIVSHFACGEGRHRYNHYWGGHRPKREDLSGRIDDEAKKWVRTMASVLVNGFEESENYHLFVVDKALINHFGAIAMAMRLSDSGEILLVGDINQLPYIDRENIFEMKYCRPKLVTPISQELLCTHRNRLDTQEELTNEGHI